MPDAAGFGEVLRREPGLVTTDELAASLRVPVTILADVLRRRTHGFGLPPAQARVLSQLSAGDSLSLSQLAQSHQLANSSMTELVNRLALADLVERQADPEDARRVRVRLTQTGNAQLAALSEAHRAELQRLRPLLGDLLARL